MKYSLIAGAAFLAAAAVPASATTTTFAQFFQQNPSARLFSYTNLDNGATKAATITGNAIPVYFNYGLSGLPADLASVQFATLSVNFVSNQGTTGTGSDRSQAFDTSTNGSISLIRTTAAAEGAGTRTNLLTVSFTNASLEAGENAGAFTFASTVGSTITFTSDFLNFSQVIEKDFSFSFSGSAPTFSAPIGSSSRNLAFSGTGTFASNPPPSVPEPASWALMLVGFGALGASMRARKAVQANNFA